VAMKSSDNTYDFFKIAPFSQKRAAFYLTQADARRSEVWARPWTTGMDGYRRRS
ncbi:unnamed protein product, partial [Durusdinium trenchii]